jgi:glycine hydroxymethyltransferase
MHKPTTNPEADWDVIEIEGFHARGFCNVAMTNDVYALGPGAFQPTWVLEPDGRLMSPAVLRRPGAPTDCLQLLMPKAQEPRVAHWLRSLSDGFVHMDDDDVFALVPGPVVVRRLSHTLSEGWPECPPTSEAFDDETVGWAFHKPYWIGQRARAGAPGGLQSLPPFSWQEPAEGTGSESPLQRTSLYDAHVEAGARMTAFAGWDMPVQFSTVQEEHLAVRQAAGLFDVGHMGIVEFGGENVHLFLTTVATNDVTLLGEGEAQYSFLLDPEGRVIDDVYLYRLEPDHYWMVVNAGNAAKVSAWLSAVREGSTQIDPGRPWSHALGTAGVVIRDMRDPARGSGMRMLLALQGPRSRDILLSMLPERDPLRERILELQRNQITHGRLAGYDLYLSRSGYTGEPVAFEIFVHPAAASALWQALLEAGKPFGLQPCGLAARDSLRIEAGLPLYGHELAGSLDLNPADAGFDPYVKLYKPFFIGKAAYMARERVRQARLVRFRFDEQRARMPRQGDVVVSRKGRVVGAVTSCSIDSEGWLTGLAYLQKPYAKVGERLGVFQVENRSWASKPLSDLRTGDQVLLHDAITVIKRFLDKKE